MAIGPDSRFSSPRPSCSVFRWCVADYFRSLASRHIAMNADNSLRSFSRS